MKKIFLIGCMAVSLTACASTQAAYGPTDQNGLGFRNVQLEPDRFRVSFTGRNYDEARDYALLRAAELTDAEGYSHFRIVNGGTQDNGRSRVGTSVGVNTGFGGRRRFNRSFLDLGIGVDDVGRAIEGSKVKETIEVRLLNGSVPNDPNVYHAQSLIKSIQPALFPPQQQPAQQQTQQQPIPQNPNQQVPQPLPQP